VSSDSTDDIISTFSERRMAKTLRVFYVTAGNQGVPINSNYLSSRLFVPVRLGARKFESMTQTMDRIDCWLRVSGKSTNRRNYKFISLRKKPIYVTHTVRFFLQERTFIVLCNINFRNTISLSLTVLSIV